MTADERVLILYDRRANAGAAWALRRAATARGANAHVRFLGTDRPGAGDAFAEVVEELVDVDVVVAFTSSSALTSPAAHVTVAHGGRVVTMTGADERMLTHGAIEADFTELAPTCELFAAKVTDAVEAEVQSANGTKIRMSLRGRSGVPNPPGRPRAGVFRAPYAGVVVAPVENSVDGTIVVDVSTSFGQVDSPVTILLEHGRVVAVTGGAAAQQIERMLADTDDPLSGTVGVVGFGMNPAASVCGVISQDVAMAGTGHLSLGPNRGIGGASDGHAYVELVYAQPTLFLNGAKVMRDGAIADL
ncbi:MAG: hypothetical protein GEV10_22195 [Streptosporangiales bacterium]|nr:hypothetical protein [Streptosporangiales bacterium]